MTYTCPVCGYPELEEPPEEWAICPSCGTQFDFDTLARVPELRRYWIAQGAPWWSEDELRPVPWDPTRQLRNTGYMLSLEDSAAIAAGHLTSAGAIHQQDKAS